MTPFWDPNFTPPCGQLAAPYLYAHRVPGPQGWYNTVRVMYRIVPIQYCNVTYRIVS